MLAPTQSFATTFDSSLLYCLPYWVLPLFWLDQQLSLSKNSIGELWSLPCAIYKLEGSQTKCSHAWSCLRSNLKRAKHFALLQNLLVGFQSSKVIWAVVFKHGQSPCIDIYHEYTQRRLFISLQDKAGIEAQMSDFPSIFHIRTNHATSILLLQTHRKVLPGQKDHIMLCCKVTDGDSQAGHLFPLFQPF